MEKQKFNFKKGQLIHLDTIYDIQGLAGGDWWEHCDNDIGDDLIITKNVSITITWETKD